MKNRLSKKIFGIVYGVLLSSLVASYAIMPALASSPFTRIATSDRGDGTYNNPVIFGDFPDPDVIRVDDTYYMITTTMHIFPGATILKSKDLVNWEYCANPLERLEATDPYDLANGKSRYGHGQWATSMQWHDGKFYVLFLTLEEGGYLLTATNPEGPWTKTKLKQGYYDCGLMFEGNKKYVAYGINEIHIAELDDKFNPIQDKVVTKGTLDSGMEGCRLYKINGYYYIYATYPGWPGRQTIHRSQNIWGPYEEKMVLADGTATHQGALVETKSGDWWTILFRDNGPLGRMPFLLPVKWEGGWPVIGTNGTAGDHYTKPVAGTEPKGLPTNDPFREVTLGLQWGWNHNSDRLRWSLTERPGWLRLRTPNITTNPYEARNTLTQRVLAYHNDKGASYGTVAIDISHMADGDICGFGLFQDPLAFIGVKMNGTSKHIVYYSSSLTSKTGKVEQSGPSLNGDIIYLRAVPEFSTGKAKFYYSLDNSTYTRFGPDFKMEYDLSVFTGNKFSIFNYATKALGGYVDVDWFSTEPEFTEEKFYSEPFTGHDKDALTATALSTDLGTDPFTMLTGDTRTVSVKAAFADGHTEDVTTAITAASSTPSAVLERGRLSALQDGFSNITLKFTDPLGGKCSATVKVESTMFPLVEGLFNPCIWENGWFNPDTHEVKVGTYGFAGWEYGAGINISDYKYCVAKLGGPDTDHLSFRIFDTESYWADCCMANFDKDGYASIKLSDFASDQGRKMNPAHVYRVGIWGFGNNSFILDKVYLTKSDDFHDSGIGVIVTDDASSRVDVYTATGLLIRRNVEQREAAKGLPAGIYIIGNRKILIHD